MTLHLINKTSTAQALNEQVSNAIEAGDSVLLFEDGVLQCLSSPNPEWHATALSTFVLSDDATARGIKIPEGFTEIDYNGFVKLSIEHNKVVSWY